MSDPLTIRAPTDTDRPAILHVLRDAFRREEEANLVELLWRDDAMNVEVIAEEEGEIVGYCGFSPITTEPASEGILFGLAPLAVLNARQGHGIGKALAMKGLEECRNKNAELIVVLGEPDYYARFGFKPAADFNAKWAALDAGPAFQLIDFEGVTDERPLLIHYHPAFSEV